MCRATWANSFVAIWVSVEAQHFQENQQIVIDEGGIMYAYLCGVRAEMTLEAGIKHTTLKAHAILPKQ